MDRLVRIGCGCCIPYLLALSLGACAEPQVVRGREKANRTHAVVDAAVRGNEIRSSASADDAGEPVDADDAGDAPDANVNAADAAVAQDASGPASDAGTTMQPPAPEDRCLPHGGGPYVVLEGETLTLTVKCTQERSEPGSLQFESLPAGASFASDTATLTWLPGLDQGGHYELTVRDTASDEAATVIVDVVDRFDAVGNKPVDPLHYFEEYGLPVIHVVTDPRVNADEYTPATIVYRGHAYEGTEAKLRGATSLSYPKNSYTLKFTKADKFNEPSFAGGFLKKRKVALTTTFDDNSYVRQRLAYELWNRLDPSHIRMQAYNAVLFLNGSYYGLYYVTDHVDGFLMEDFGHNQDGDLYKARGANANFRATINGTQTPKETLHDGYSKEEGFPEEGQEGAFDNLDAFVRWVVETPAEQLGLDAPSHIALRDYVDWWIFASFAEADDSISKNSFHYRDPLLAGSVWHYIPWDFNQSFGQDWNTKRVSPMLTRPEVLYPRQNNLFEKLLAGPQAPAMRQRYSEVLAHGGLEIEGIIALFDAFVAEVDASAKRDESKWGDKYRSFGHWYDRTDFTSYEQEVAYTRQWIRDRHAYLQSLYPLQAGNGAP